MNASDFCAKLSSTIPSEDGAHIQTLEKLTTDGVKLADRPEVAEAIFVFFERNSTADLGAPGPLVHYLEGAFPSYVEALVASIKRRPVGYTLWMANRILNAKIPQQMRETLLRSLEQVANNPLTSDFERRQAYEFIGRHTAAS